MSRRDVGGVDQECLKGDEEGGTEPVPTGDHPNDFPLVFGKPCYGYEYGGEGDHVSSTSAEDAVGEGEGGDVGVEGEVGEEGGQGEQHASKYQTATLTKYRNKD